MITNDQPHSGEKNKDLNIPHNKSKEERIKAIKRYLGVLKLTEDPLVMQRRWRDEWED